MITWARNRRTGLAGLDLESEATLSPGLALGSCSWCISTLLHSAVSPVGANMIFMPGFKIPVSTRPTGTVPIPWILYTSCRGRRSGLSVGRFGGLIVSSTSRRVLPQYFFGAPKNQGMLVDFLMRLSPSKPEIGINLAFLYMFFFSNHSLTLSLTSLKRVSL